MMSILIPRTSYMMTTGSTALLTAPELITMHDNPFSVPNDGTDVQNFQYILYKAVSMLCDREAPFGKIGGGVVRKATKKPAG